MFEEISKALAAIYGLPGYGVVFFSAIAFGYVLRTIKKFPNGGIPVAVVLWGALWNPLLADVYSPPASLRLWLVKNVLLGFLFGFVAWILHKAALKKLEDKFGWFKGMTENSDIYKRGAPGWEKQDPDPAKRIEDPPTLDCAACAPKVDKPLP